MKPKLILIIAQEIQRYEEDISASKRKKKWNEIDHWKKLHYKVRAEKMIAIIKRVRERITR